MSIDERAPVADRLLAISDCLKKVLRDFHSIATFPFDEETADWILGLDRASFVVNWCVERHSLFFTSGCLFVSELDGRLKKPTFCGHFAASYHSAVAFKIWDAVDDLMWAVNRQRGPDELSDPPGNFQRLLTGETLANWQTQLEVPDLHGAFVDLELELVGALKQQHDIPHTVPFPFLVVAKNPWEGRSAVELIDTLEAARATEVDTTVKEVANLKVCALDVRLDVERCRVSRCGKDQVVDCSRSSLQWAVAALIISNGDKITERLDIATLWEGRGNKEEGEANDIQLCISRINKQIRCLGVKLESVRNTGYRLSEIPQHQSSKKQDRSDTGSSKD